MTMDDADVVILMTCAIRENAENKIWNRLSTLRSLERQRKKDMIIGVLGCMAERLKERFLEKEKLVDVVCGPDAYRSLPTLLQRAETGQFGINVQLSFDETYADVSPIRLDESKKTAFISIMRGCNNMCSYCIVPFTRGRERSRPIDSIVSEARSLRDRGVKEIILLGQNVNSYRDESVLSFSSESPSSQLSQGFSSICKPKTAGLHFPTLLEKVSDAVPEVRLRFTSPHPKDFPDDLLYLMRERKNICKQIHLPVQSGSSTVLERMRRGYTREAYLGLVDHIRSIIPNVSFSSDFIVGFCEETEEEFMETLSLVKQVEYDMAYMYAYSMREKTMAHRRFEDDVPEDVKQRRLRLLIDTFYAGLANRVQGSIGNAVEILVEGESRKDPGMLSGKTDGNRTVVFTPRPGDDIKPGDMVKVLITDVKGITPIAIIQDEIENSSVLLN
jgi:tRNA-N(6)-(isopentenyl)adenosine-37 thiotransferase enzyme MiaB